MHPVGPLGVRPYITKFTQLRTLVVCENPDAVKVRYNPPLRSAEDVWHFSRPLFQQLDADKEHFGIITLNNKNRFTGWKVISTGTLTTALVHPRGSLFRCPRSLSEKNICEWSKKTDI